MAIVVAGSTSLRRYASASVLLDCCRPRGTFAGMMLRRPSIISMLTAVEGSLFNSVDVRTKPYSEEVLHW